MKKRNLLIIMLALFAFVFAAAPLGKLTMANAYAEPDPADQVFEEFILSDDFAQGELSYVKSDLYDESLAVAGREYRFTVGQMQGYALVARIPRSDQTYYYEVEELVYRRSSPFEDCEGIPVYVTHRTYLEYKNGAFYDLLSDTPLTSAQVEEYAYKGFGFCDLGTFETHTETISYHTKQTESYDIPSLLPNYYGSHNGETSCANTAGCVIIGYYDRFCPNLIPNYQSYIQFGNAIVYKSAGEEVVSVLDQLYVLMGTDNGYLGTTFAGFQSGMQQYATNNGYSYSSTSVFSGGSLNMTSYKTSVQAGKPVAIFLINYALVNGIVENENEDLIQSSRSSVSHVVIGCGYKIDRYYDEQNRLTQTRTYLRVASGLDSHDIGYLNVNGLSQIHTAISTLIN